MRTRNHGRAMVRELERAFFDCAFAAGAAFTTAETDIEKILEALSSSLKQRRMTL